MQSPLLRETSIFLKYAFPASFITAQMTPRIKKVGMDARWPSNDPTSTRSVKCVSVCYSLIYYFLTYRATCVSNSRLTVDTIRQQFSSSCIGCLYHRTSIACQQFYKIRNMEQKRYSVPYFVLWIKKEWIRFNEIRIRIGNYKCYSLPDFLLNKE